MALPTNHSTPSGACRHQFCTLCDSPKTLHVGNEIRATATPASPLSKKIESSAVDPAAPAGGAPASDPPGGGAAAGLREALHVGHGNRAQLVLHLVGMHCTATSREGRLVGNGGRSRSSGRAAGEQARTTIAVSQQKIIHADPARHACQLCDPGRVPFFFTTVSRARVVCALVTLL